MNQCDSRATVVALTKAPADAKVFTRGAYRGAHRLHLPLFAHEVTAVGAEQMSAKTMRRLAIEAVPQCPQV